MEERYWNKFMESGKVGDYLNYRGMAICTQVMRRYGEAGRDRTGDRNSEPDKCNGNGSFSYSDRGIR